MLLEEILHTIGNLLSMNPPMFDVHMTLVLMMTITFMALGILNLVLATAPDLPVQLLRRVVWVNVVRVAASVALCWFYGVSPPLICGIVTEVPLAGALLARN